MYLKITGNIDATLLVIDIANHGKVKENTLTTFFSNGVEVVGFENSGTIDTWRMKAEAYDSMYPKMSLNEDWVNSPIKQQKLMGLFSKFFVPLSAEACRVTIVDPYIFAKGTNVTWLSSIIIDNVKSKEIRFVRNQANDDSVIFQQIESILKNNGFNVSFINAGATLHDRWWYTRKSGFTIGISFNGINKKNSTIKMLDDAELNQIILNHGV